MAKVTFASEQIKDKESKKVYCERKSQSQKYMQLAGWAPLTGFLFQTPETLLFSVEKVHRQIQAEWADTRRAEMHTAVKQWYISWGMPDKMPLAGSKTSACIAGTCSWVLHLAFLPWLISTKRVLQDSLALVLKHYQQTCKIKHLKFLEFNSRTNGLDFDLNSIMSTGLNIADMKGPCIYWISF